MYLLCVIYLVTYPLDPENWPGTPEYMELMEECAKRAHYLAEAMAEEYAMDRHRF